MSKEPAERKGLTRALGTSLLAVFCFGASLDRDVLRIDVSSGVLRTIRLYFGPQYKTVILVRNTRDQCTDGENVPDRSNGHTAESAAPFPRIDRLLGCKLRCW